MGIKALRKVLIGKENVAGSAVVATAIWRGMGVIEDQRTVVFPDEDVGYLSGVDRSYVPKLGAAITLEGPATFEQLPYFLAAGVQNTASGTADGSGSGQIYAYNMSTTSTGSIFTYTVESGNDVEAEKVEFAFVKRINLSGTAGEALNVTAEWTGRQSASTTFTSGIALPSVEEVLFSKGKLYSDDVSASMGATQLSNTFVSAEIDIQTGQQEVYTGDGQIYFTFRKQTAPEIVATITFEHDSSATAEKNRWRSGCPRKLRMAWDGTAISPSGTSYANKKLIVDLCGKWEKFDALSEADGNDLVTGTFRARFDPTAGSFARITVVTTGCSLA